MARPRVCPTEKELDQYLRMGLTHQQIADEVWKATGHKIARSTVSAAISRAGMAKQEAYEEIPWTVRIEHQRDYPVRVLRWLARRNRDLPLNEDESRRLDSWLVRCERENAVVVYDPDIGFAYADRCDDCLPDVPAHPYPVKFD